jgi:tRNA (adenine22-N1)-methyltransferase
VKLSKRLSKCVRYTKGFQNLADIGTDHAQLPIYAIRKEYVKKAQAIDNKKGPFVVAYDNVKNAGLDNKITVKLSDGLRDIDTDTDVVVIAGMGGGLISKILDKSLLQSVKRFILQPNNDAFKIRKILSDIDYKIIDEIVIEENNLLYEIIVIEKGGQSLSDLEIQFGPINLKKKPELFIEKIKKELNYLHIVVRNIEKAEQKEHLLQRIQLLEEVLK